MDFEERTRAMYVALRMVSITDSSGDDASFWMEKNADIRTVSLPVDQSSRQVCEECERA